jgi:hypothetical protein
VATISALADRLRSELGDLGKSFVYQFVADGTTNRFLIPYSPLDGAGLIVLDAATDVSNSVTVEEETGYITFDTVPTAGHNIVISGTYFRYFTNEEICHYVDTAFGQHVANHADGYGRGYTLATLPGIEEYPVVVYASTLALYTLATDAAFDIDITAPDGVMIPRSERYRQLQQMIQTRKDQYRELCSQLGIGLYKIDVFSFRRISKTTNRYVPIYLPMEIDDRSMPQRAIISIPSYGSAISPSDVPTFDLTMYQGDSFEVELDFPFDVSGYNFKSEIRLQPASPTLVGTFTITPVDGFNNKIKLSLTPDQTVELPDRAYWDIQAQAEGDTTYEKTYMRGTVTTTRQVTM